MYFTYIFPNMKLNRTKTNVQLKNFDFFVFPLSLCITRLVQRLRLRSTTLMLRATPEVNEAWRHRSCRSPALRQYCQINIQVPNSYWKSYLHLLFLDVKALVFRTCKAKRKKKSLLTLGFCSIAAHHQQPAFPYHVHHSLIQHLNDMRDWYGGHLPSGSGTNH